MNQTNVESKLLKHLTPYQDANFLLPVIVLDKRKGLVKTSSFFIESQYRDDILKRIHERDKLAIIRQSYFPDLRANVVINCNRRTYLSGLQYISVYKGNMRLINSSMKPSFEHDIIGEIVTTIPTKH